MRFIVRFIAVTIIFVVVAAIFCVESVGVWIDIGVGCRRIFVFRVVFSCLAESCNAEIDMRNVLLSTRASSWLPRAYYVSTLPHEPFKQQPCATHELESHFSRVRPRPPVLYSLVSGCRAFSHKCFFPASVKG